MINAAKKTRRSGFSLDYGQIGATIVKAGPLASQSLPLLFNPLQVNVQVPPVELGVNVVTIELGSKITEMILPLLIRVNDNLVVSVCRPSNILVILTLGTVNTSPVFVFVED